VTLLLRFAPDLAVAVQAPAPALEALLRRYFRPQVVEQDQAPDGALQLTPEPPPAVARAGDPLLCEWGVTLRRGRGLTLLEAPGVTGWCEAAAGRGGIYLGSPAPSALETFVAVALASLLFELASARGWLGLHAAAIAPAGRGVLLPGASGAGKTTVLRSAHAAGLPVLSDDLLWVREGADGFAVRALERGVPSEAVPSPTLAEATLAAVVCPTIAARGPSRLEPIGAREAAQALLAESSFLSSGPVAGERFRTLVRLAAAVPAYRLLAGPERSEVPPLLAGLVG
jgi:hypothetical protein